MSSYKGYVSDSEYFPKMDKLAEEKNLILINKSTLFIKTQMKSQQLQMIRFKWNSKMCKE